METESDECPDASHCLVVTDETDEELLAIPVENGTIVTLAYTHSVEKTPVRDVYEVNGTALTMVRMEFDSYGAGLPSELPVDRTERGTLVAYPNGTFETLVVSPGQIAGHRLEVGNESYDLVSLADGASVEFSLEARGTEVPVDDDPSGAAPSADSPEVRQCEHRAS